MSTTIDQRVVEMRFDNKQFESATATSMSTIDKLKQKLNFSGASKGLEDIGSAAKKVNMSGLSSAVETVHSRFSALEVVGVTALANISNAAVNAGKKIVSAFTIDPVISGFHEYETQINAIQTILANTSHQGTTLEQVNAVLDDLNKYADMTIYNFTEMTKNIGTFTAAGVGLEDSAEAIKGIANLAAMSGSTSVQASTAMYQLSQAIASGTVSLQDWNSVVNAGMGGKVFQDALIRTAAAMQGISEEAFRAKNVTTSFRESINAQTGTGWLDADVLVNTLRQFTGDLSDAELKAQGFTDEQIANIQSLAKTANDAATQVKTFTQLWDTLNEAAQSGWTQTWEILIGDFEESKQLLTELSDLFGGIINQSAESRNALLYDTLTSNWKKITDGITEAGLSADDFKDKVTEIAKSQGVDIDKLVEEYGSLESVFKEGAASSDILDKALSKMTGTSEEISKKLQDLRGDYKTNGDLLKALTDAGYEQNEIEELRVKNLKGEKIALNDLTDAQLMSIGYTEEQVLSIRELSKASEIAGGSLKEFTDNVAVDMGREMIVDALRNSLESLISVCQAVGQAWRDVFPPTTSDQLLSVIQSIRDFTDSLRPSEETLDKIQRTFRGLFSILSIGKQIISSILSPIGNLLGGVGELSGGILDLTASFGDWLVALDKSFKAGDSFAFIGDGISHVLDLIMGGIRNVISGIGGFKGAFSSIGDFISGVFNTVLDVANRVVTWIRENISGGDIFAGLAGGGIFLVAKKLSGLIETFKDLFDGFGGGEGSTFSDILDSVHGSLESFQQGLQVGSLVGIAAAVALLTSSLRKIAELEPDKIAYSLVAIRLMIAALDSGFKSLVRSLNTFGSKGVLRGSIAMIAIAEAINILATAMEKIAKLDMAGIGKGLLGIGGLLIELSVAIRLMSKGGVTLRTSIAVLALAKACEMLGDAFVKFSSLSWDEIGRGLVAMGGALGELTIALGVLSKVGGFGSLLGSVGILIAVQSLDEISENLERLGKMTWVEISRGLSAMGGALGELTIALGILSKIGGFGAILGGIGILIAVQSLDEISENLERLGSMSWEEIGRGLAAMGGALVEVGAVTGILGKLAGFSGILGSTSILITVQSLGDLANGFEQFSQMSWDEIGHGLASMGGALAEVGIVSGALGKLAGFSGILGGATIWVTVQSLHDLSVAFQDFASMSWDEIGRGLVAMGGALLEVGAISGALGTFAGLAGILGGASIWITVQGLGDLADALAKFGEMSWDEIGRGLSAMGAALAETALGGVLNTFSGIGASSIATIAEPLGVLADSVKKWIGIEVPEDLGDQLASLADGITAFTFGGWGADAISTIAEPIGTLADSVNKWKNVSVPSDLGTQIGSLASGISAFNFSGWGADTISVAAPGVGDMADSVKKWADVTVPDGIEEDLTGIANGVKAFSFAFLGGWSIGELTDPLGNLSDSIKKWDGVSIPEGIGDDLSDLATGVKAFTFGGWGTDNIGELVEPLGNLSDSIGKWTNITIPEDLGSGLETLASGVKAFNFSGWGADAIGELAAPLGILADSVGKWSSVSIPEDLNTGLTSLADGVKAFTFSGWGADSLSSSASGVADMADAVSKWTNIKIPDGIEEGLTSIANGVKAFNFGLTSSWSIDSFEAIVAPLGNLADSVRKWSGITEYNVGESLTEISVGVKDLKNSGIGDDFSEDVKSFFDALSSSSVRTAIANIDSLMSSLSKMSSINSGDVASFGSALQSLGQVSVSGLTASIQNGAYQAGAAISSMISTMKTSIINGSFVLGGAASNVGMTVSNNISNGIRNGLAVLPSIISSSIGSLSASLSSRNASFKVLGQNLGNSFVESFKTSIASLSKSVSSVMTNISATISGKVYSFRNSGVQMATNMIDGFISGSSKFNSSISNLLTSLSATLSKSYPTFRTAGLMMMMQMINGVNTQSAEFRTTFVKLLELVISTIKLKYQEIYNAGQTLMTKFTDGIASKEAAARSVISNLISSLSSSIKNGYSGFYSAGSYLVQGFINGMEAHMDDVRRAARRLAQEAYEAAMDELDEHSPSRKFHKIGEFVAIGFANGITSSEAIAGNSAKEMADTAISTVRSTISKMVDLINDDIDPQPTIRPVLDLSDVQSGTARLNTMFSRTRAMSISTSMAPRSTIQEEPDTGVTSKSGATFQFTQNNYSPKALSRVEIYRQTNNQFSAFERMVRA